MYKIKFVILAIIISISAVSQRAEASFDEVLYYEQIQSNQNNMFDINELNSFDGHKVLTERTDTGSIKRYFDSNYNKVRVIEYDEYGEIYRITNIKYDKENKLKGLQGIVNGVIEYYDSNHEKITPLEWERL